MTAQKKHNFMDWLESTIPDTLEMRAIAREEQERYNLVSALRGAREAVGHTQSTLAAELGVKQALISKWEHINHNHTFHTLQKWFQKTDAKLVMGLEVGGKFVPISERAESVLLLPEKLEARLEELAQERGVSLRDVVLAALQQHVQPESFAQTPLERSVSPLRLEGPFPHRSILPLPPEMDVSPQQRVGGR